MNSTTPNTFDMQGLLNSLEIGKPFPIEDLNDTSVATIITTHKTLVDGIPVDSGPNHEKDSVKYIIKLGWLEYTLKGIVDVYTDILVDIRNDINNKGMFSLRDIDIKKAYLYLKVLEANIDRFPYYRNVIRSYINVFFSNLLKQLVTKGYNLGKPSVNILVTNNFYLTYYYGLGVSLSSMYGNFVLGHLLQDMSPGGVSILHYIYKYMMDADVVPNIKFRDKGFEFEIKNDFAISQVQHTGWNAKSREVSLDDFAKKIELNKEIIHSYVIENLYGELDDKGVVANITQLLRQAIEFNEQKTS